MWQITEYLGAERNDLDPAEFESKFLEICEAHRAQGRALAFAFILFDRRHANIRLALDTTAYWDSLDALSGRTLTVFSFSIERRVRPRTRFEPGVMYHMVPIGLGGFEPTDAVKQYFPDFTLSRLPCVLFFQVQDKQVVDSMAVAIKQELKGVEEAYREVSELISAAVAALSQVEDENASNAKEIFNLIRGAIRDRAIKSRFIKILRATESATSTASLVQMLLSLV